MFDLDPPGDDQFGEARRAALLVCGLLEGELGLTTFVKTTGGHGLHVYVPLARRPASTRSAASPGRPPACSPPGIPS